MRHHRRTRAATAFASFPRRFLLDRRGNVAAMAAMLLIPLIAAMGLAGEVGGWYTINRSMQNAADAAAIAAATNGATTNDNSASPLAGYQREAYAVAKTYGYVTGTNTVNVAASSATCPSGSGTCFEVDISRTIPFYLLNMSKYTGNGSGGQLITAKAIASATGAAPDLCILALGANGVVQDLQVNGGPKTNMDGCSVASNGDATCNGQGIGGVDYSFAGYNLTDNCAPSGGVNQNLPNGTTLTDPYLSTVTNNINGLTNPCGSYPQESSGQAPNSNLLQGSISGTVYICGEAQLGYFTTNKKGAQVFNPGGTLSLAAGTVLVIENGDLDLAGGTISGTGVTIVLSGTSSSTYQHIITGSGNLDISAPTSGSWTNFALVQDPSLAANANLDMTSAGNTPNWNVSGLVYAPHSNITIKGAINDPNTGGISGCISFLVQTITISGTGYIVNNSTNCSFSEPNVYVGKIALVQ